jgi:hypothetical protein
MNRKDPDLKQMLKEDSRSESSGNFIPKETGLPMVLWLYEKKDSKLACRIKLQKTYGNKIIFGNFTTVTVEEYPRIIGGRIKEDDFILIKKFIAINKKPLLQYWNYKISTLEFIHQMKKVKRKRMSRVDLLFLMANIRPKYTGLPMVIWISENYEEGDECNIKVQIVHGENSDQFNWIAVTVSNDPNILGKGILNQKDFALVKRFILLNREPIIRYWNHETGTDELLNALVKLENKIGKRKRRK